MKSLLILLLLVDLTFGMALYAEFRPHFEAFKKTFRKVYSTPMAEARAFKNYVGNKLYIDNYNALHANDEDKIVLKENRFSDLSEAERQKFG